MKQIMFVVCLVSPVVLAGCMPSTLVELKQTGVHHSFAVSAPYQTIYHDVSHMLHRCVDRGPFLNWHITENLYPNLEFGEFMLSTNNMGDQSVQFHIKVSQLNGETKVNVFAADAGIWSDYPTRLESWLKTGNESCP